MKEGMWLAMAGHSQPFPVESFSFISFHSVTMLDLKGG
jgi:hypothetical protein